MHLTHCRYFPFGCRNSFAIGIWVIWDVEALVTEHCLQSPIASWQVTHPWSVRKYPRLQEHFPVTWLTTALEPPLHLHWPSAPSLKYSCVQRSHLSLLLQSAQLFNFPPSAPSHLKHDHGLFGFSRSKNIPGLHFVHPSWLQFKHPSC